MNDISTIHRKNQSRAVFIYSENSENIISTLSLRVRV